jgi:hypothetical protein
MLWIRKRLHSPDDGFSLVEAVVSLTIIAIVMASFSVAMIGSVKAAMVARQNQQAGDVLNRAVEQLRALGYSSVALDPADVTTPDGGYLSSCAGGTCLSVNGTPEKLALASGGLVSPHISTLTLNKVPYTVREYVTLPTDSEAGATYKRLTVVATWKALGRAHTRATSTIITNTRRGLPLPMYKFSPVGPTTDTVNPGAGVLFGFKLTNNGARDAWNFTTNAPTLGWSYAFDDGDNSYDAATDTTAVSDTTGDGIIDTGPIDPTKSVVIWVLRTVPLTPAGPYSSTATFTVTSFAEPAYTSTLSTTVNVQSGAITPTPSPTPSATASPTPTPSPTASASCPVQASVPTASASAGSSVTGLTLFNENPNATAPENSVALGQLVLDKNNTATSGTLFDYSTNDGTTASQIQAGRALQPSALGVSETNALKVARFTYTSTKNGTSAVKGTATVSLWAVPQSGLSADPVSLSFALVSRLKSGNTTSVVTQASTSYTLAPWGCTTFNKITVSLSNLNFSMKNNDSFDLYVTTTGSSNLRIAYGASDYAATMQVPL